MPNLRGKTWTTTTPANVGDAQYWEDHLISDEAAQKAAGAVQSVNNTLPDENGNINITPSPLGPTVVDSLNSTSATDALSANQGHALKDLVDTKQKEIEQIYADNGVLGAKNLSPNNATSKTINGVTFTVNADGSVTANGTATAGTLFDISGSGYIPKTFINCVLNGCSGGSQNTYFICLSLSNNGTSWANEVDVWDGEKVVPDTYSYYKVQLYISANTTVNNIVFKPMLRLASDPDDTYVPYAMTNRELTEELTVQESAVTDIVEGASVGSDYGNHLIKKGNIVLLSLKLTRVTAQQWKTVICRIPEGYRPKYRTAFCDINAGKYLYCMPSGIIQSGTTNFSNTELLISATWITD